MAPIRIAMVRLREVIPELRPVESGGASLEVALSRVERPETKVARLLEGDELQARPLSTSPPAVTAFLDGVQESREVAWIGSVPLVYGRVAAVVRERVNRRLVTWGDGLRHESAIYAPWRRLSQRDRALVEEGGFHTRDVTAHDTGAVGSPIPDEPHPLRILQEASNAVKQDREVIERHLAELFCRTDPGILYLDGSLPGADAVHASSRVVGVIKSHQTLYVSGADLSRVFALAMGERSSAFAVESRHRPAVASWYLRVRDAAGRDPFWGLVRVEVPMAEFDSGGADLADERSAWVLAERAPVALPDGRWDTMAYGIRNCEEFLRALSGREG